MRKPDKTRIVNAVGHIESDEIAFLEHDPDMVLVNQMLGKDFSLGLHAYELPAEDYVELNRRMGNDMVYFGEIWRLGRKEKTDDQERIHYIDGTMKTPQSLKDIWYPDLDVARKRLEELLNAIEGTGFGIACCNKFAASVVCTAVGYEDYWLALYDNPGFIHEFQKIINEYCLRELEMFINHNVDMIHLGIGIGSKAGPMCSRKMLEEFQYPLLRQQINLAKAGGRMVHLHVDGNIKDLIADFIEMGVDILHPLEPCDGKQDIYEIKKTHGNKITLHGNIDVAGVLLKGTPEEVALDVNEHIAKLAPGGGYILGSSHDLHAAVPLDNFYAMRDAAHAYCLKNE
ncbi:MAG: hypothetical protein KAV87_09180 [Desulfobacteraceae bacterium]|nr:hypothetical protein [Desulfobacteraceae bacterium]